MVDVWCGGGEPLLLSGVQGQRASHTQEQKGEDMSGVYSSLFMGSFGCGRKFGKVGRGYTRENWSGAKTVWGNEKGAEG